MFINDFLTAEDEILMKYALFEFLKKLINYLAKNQ